MSPLLVAGACAGRSRPGRTEDGHGQDALSGERELSPQCTVTVAVVKRVALWAFVAFAVFFVAYSPHSAATVARWLGRTLVSVANGFGEFFAGLVS